jgi:hypothetical protein
MLTSDLIHIYTYLNTHKTADCSSLCSPLRILPPDIKKMYPFSFHVRREFLPTTALWRVLLTVKQIWTTYIPKWTTKETYHYTYNNAPTISPVSSIMMYLCTTVSRYDFLSHYTTATHHIFQNLHITSTKNLSSGYTNFIHSAYRQLVPSSCNEWHVSK